MIQVVPGVHQIQTIASNLYLVVDGDELTLIDAGTKARSNPYYRQYPRSAFSPGD